MTSELPRFEIPDFLDPSNHAECNRVANELGRLLKYMRGLEERAAGPVGWPDDIRTLYANLLLFRSTAPDVQGRAAGLRQAADIASSRAKFWLAGADNDASGLSYARGRTAVEIANEILDRLATAARP